MKLAIVGSRKMPREHIPFIQHIANNYSPTLIISGGAIGVDSYAEEIAKTLNVSFREFKPDKKYPIPDRYYIRNELIAKEADHILAFYYERKTPGTSHTIWVAKQLNKSFSEFIL